MEPLADDSLLDGGSGQTDFIEIRELFIVELLLELYPSISTFGLCFSAPYSERGNEPCPTWSHDHRNSCHTVICRLQLTPTHQVYQQGVASH